MHIDDKQQSHEIEQLKAKVSEQAALIQHLEKLVDYLQRKPFRPSSEANAGMAPLFNEAEVEAPKADEAEKKTRVAAHDRARPVRTELPESWPREVIRHELPEDQRQCSCCGGALHEIGVEAREEIDIIPARVRALRHERVKYGCRGCESQVVTASAPKAPIPKSLASPATLAHIVVSKYADHLPLYRQEAIWARLGVALDRATLANWMIKAGDLVQPLINLLSEDILKDGVVHCDETTVQVLKEKGKKATSPGYMWVLSRAGPGPIAHIFEYDPSRSGRVAKRLLSTFRGVLVTDGFDGYKQLELLGMTRAACWAHVRRKFVEAVDIEGKGAADTVAHRMLDLIRALYAVEASCKDISTDDRRDVRQCESVKLMTEIDRLLSEQLLCVPPKSPTGRALRYLKDEWPALQIFLRDGRVPIDNNRVENAIRPFALGRKNWLFSTSPSGARASANLYSLVETAKANGLDPQAYLTEVFTKLPNAQTADQVGALLPYPAKH